MSYANDLRWSLLLLGILGCSAHGQISVSHPKVWRQSTIAEDSSARINELKSDQKTLNEALKNVAGSRLRRETIETQVRLSAKSQPETKGGVVSSAEPKVDANQPPADITNQKVMKDYDAFGPNAGEEALDILRRKEDFGDLFTGTLLKYIRDDLSLRPGRRLYLLQFDISVNPDGFTSSSGLFNSGYSARVRVEVSPQNTEYYTARVYAIAPQQYAERFREGLARRDDLSLALDVEKQSPGQGAKFALDRAMRSQEELALIQRYPLISGFVEAQSTPDTKNTFGWQINPRFRVIDRPAYISWLTGKYGVENSMEDGIRTGLVAIEITSIEVEKAIDKEKETPIAARQPDKIKEMVQAERSKDVKLNVRVNTYWESNNLHEKVYSGAKDFVVILPGDHPKVFSGVHPKSGPGNRENVIVIAGEDFGTRADVYVGSMKACSVKILSRELIEATLPKCFGDDCTKEQDIKVISQGVPYQGQGTFEYKGPPAKPGANGSTVPCANTTGNNDQTSDQPKK